MRFARLVAASLLAILPASAQVNWQLFWSDEFNGAANTPLDSSKWTYDLGGGGWGNQELETYTNSVENSHMDGNGNLVIHVVHTPDGGYTSARIKTQGKYSFKYGKIEARMKIPFGQGMWPAFWMLGADIDTIGWPACGEVDIMENIGREPSIIHGTVHAPGYYGGDGISAADTLSGAHKFADDFHVFSIIWAPQSVQFLVDGSAYTTVTPASIPPGAAWDFDKSMFLILNVAVGGGWPGYPDNTTVFPQDMLIDYVRVYQVATSPPSVHANGVVNAASFASALAPGSLAAAFGDALSDVTSANLFDQTRGAFPEEFQGAKVYVDGHQSALTYVSPGQINFQIPWETPVGTPVPVQVVRNGLKSNSVNVTLTATAPSAFLNGSTAIVNCSGGTCTLWGNGFGSTNPEQHDGVPSSLSGPAWATATCKLTIGGWNAPISYCGAAPSLVIDQLNFAYPTSVPTQGQPVSAALTIGSTTGTFQLP